MLINFRKVNIFALNKDVNNFFAHLNHTKKPLQTLQL